MGNDEQCDTILNSQMPYISRVVQTDQDDQDTFYFLTIY